MELASDWISFFFSFILIKRIIFCGCSIAVRSSRSKRRSCFLVNSMMLQIGGVDKLGVEQIRFFLLQFFVVLCAKWDCEK